MLANGTEFLADYRMELSIIFEFVLCYSSHAVPLSLHNPVYDLNTYSKEYHGSPGINNITGEAMCRSGSALHRFLFLPRINY